MQATEDLRELLGDPSKLDCMSPADAAEALVQLATLQAALAARLRIAPSTAAVTNQPPEGDRLLAAEDVAKHFGRSVAWVYRQAKHWNFTRRVTPRTLRFSEAGLRRFLAHRRAFTP